MLAVSPVLAQDVMPKKPLCSHPQVVGIASFGSSTADKVLANSPWIGVDLRCGNVSMAFHLQEQDQVNEIRSCGENCLVEVNASSSAFALELGGHYLREKWGVGVYVGITWQTVDGTVENTCIEAEEGPQCGLQLPFKDKETIPMAGLMATIFAGKKRNIPILLGFNSVRGISVGVGKKW